MDGDEEHSLVEQVKSATSAVWEAAAKLESGDPYGLSLCQWLDELENLADEDRPGKPPWLDKRKGSEVVRKLRSDARDAALDLRRILHEDWHAIRHELDVRQKAEYDSQCDWSRAGRNEAAAIRRIICGHP